MLESLPSESRRLGNIQRKTIPHQSFSLNHPGKRCLSLKPNHFPRLNLRRGSLHPLRSKEIQSPKLCTSHQHLTTTPPKKKKKKPNQTKLTESSSPHTQAAPSGAPVSVGNSLRDGNRVQEGSQGSRSGTCTREDIVSGNTEALMGFEDKESATFLSRSEATMVNKESLVYIIRETSDPLWYSVGGGVSSLTQLWTRRELEPR